MRQKHKFTSLGHKQFSLTLFIYNLNRIDCWITHSVQMHLINQIMVCPLVTHVSCKGNWAEFLRNTMYNTWFLLEKPAFSVMYIFYCSYCCLVVWLTVLTWFVVFVYQSVALYLFVTIGVFLSFRKLFDGGRSLRPRSFSLCELRWFVTYLCGQKVNKHCHMVYKRYNNLWVCFSLSKHCISCSSVAWITIC